MIDIGATMNCILTPAAALVLGVVVVDVDAVVLDVVDAVDAVDPDVVLFEVVVVVSAVVVDVVVDVVVF